MSLIARARRIAARGDGAAPLGLGAGDWVGLELCSLVSIAGELQRR